MNRTVKKCSFICLGVIIILLIQTTFVQFFDSKKLNDNAWNARSLYKELGTKRGSILVEGEPIAKSVRTDDAFKFQRVYEDDDIYSPITGFYSIVNKADRGIESAYENELSGNTADSAMKNFVDFFFQKEKEGVDLNLTINKAAQVAAMNALKKQNEVGAILAIEPKTGKILAIASTPSYNPNDLASHDSSKASEKYQELAKSENSPLINRALSQTYPPGSTFKLITSSAVMENDKLTPYSTVPSPISYMLPGTRTYLPNYHEGNCNSEGETTMINALVISCNTTFAILGNEQGQKKMETISEKFGFEKSWTIAGKESNILNFSSAKSIFPKNLQADRLALASIGQGDVQATVLEMALVSSAIANEGELKNPYLVDSISDSQGVIKKTEQSVAANPITTQTAKYLNEMMLATVNKFSTKAKVSGVQVAGKSGTAENQKDKKPHAWFTGFAPADDPKIAIAVLVENGGTGSSASAPKAAEVIKAYLENIGAL